ncbi:MAG TPA: hypothetical protein VFO31_18040 [Vicinamibacterales bacterium]|nr:hypothetical protein [Vicinamibacterales bacterium]
MIDVGLNMASFAALFAALLVCLEAGRRWGRKAFGSTGAHPSGLGTVEAVTFGLLGLLLALTFSGAAERLDARRGQIVDEANALGTAWLRLDVLPASAQPKLRDTFRKYTDSRISVYRTFSESGLEAAQAEYARSAALQQEIWTAAVAACRDTPSAAVVVLPALNEMFDITTTRLAATQTHPPAIVYVVLALISLVCAFLVGYEMGGTEVASRAHMIVLAFVLSFTFYVILDFEYPRLGLIRIDDFDQLLVQTRASMG